MKDFTDNLIFSLNASLPIFVMMLLGGFVRKADLLDDHATARVNRFVFRVLLPVLLFMDLSRADFRSVRDGGFVMFCIAATLCCVGIAALLSLFNKDRSERGEIIQASYRSSAAVLGIAFVNNIYGHATMAALMIVGTVPIYNIAEVMLLALTSPENKGRRGKELFLGVIHDTVTNPIIIGIAAGIIWSLLRIPQPVIMERSISYLGNMATPLSLIALGASFRFSDTKGRLSTVLGIAFVKLILFCAIFLPIAVMLGFREEKLVAVLVMLGSATTSSCFIMAKNFGHKGAVTAFSVMLTTLGSSLTLTVWLFILRSLKYI